MRNHFKSAMAGLVISQLLFWIKFALVETVDMVRESDVMFPSILIVIAISLQMWVLIFGLWKKEKWVGGKFMFLLLILLAFSVLPLVFLTSHQAWFWLVCPLEIGTYIFVLSRLAKISADSWTPKRRNWGRFVMLRLLPDFFFYLTILELGLNIAGVKPGEIFPGTYYFTKVDELVSKTDYYADENGIMKLSEKGREFLITGTWEGEKVTAFEQNSSLSASTHSVYEEFDSLRRGGIENDFSHFIDSLQANPDSHLDDFAQACLTYLREPVNADGFRSIPFEQYDTTRTSVLLIGDSFTFGWSARPWTDSFADRLLARGFVVYNAGITATDPAQYAAIAKEYVPRLKPDFVITNFYIGNDIMYFPRELKPGQMSYYPTNAGVLMANPGAEYLKTPEEAYKFVLNEIYIPKNDGQWLNMLASRTVLGTLAWKVGKKYNFLHHFVNRPNQDYHDRNPVDWNNSQVANQYLKQVQKICEQEESQYISAVIPDIKDYHPDLKNKYPGLFDQLPWETPEKLGPDLYNLGDGHFNPSGHAFYADFLGSEMRIRQNKKR